MHKEQHRRTGLKQLCARTLLCANVVLTLAACHQSPVDEADRVVFNRDIRPILNEHCIGCHGGVAKQAGISFITRDEALARGSSGRRNIVPGNPDASEFIARIETHDTNLRMPYKAAALAPEKIQVLRRWIEQGAPWQEHWAFIPPEPQAIPAVANIDQLDNPIDHFVQARLASAELAPLALRPAPKADNDARLRRVTLDLTGLPPSPAQLAEFAADTSPEAYEKHVDRLLASPRFGEHWAAMWLDLARYADSMGYTHDTYRESWPYRDWVINAFNANLSYRDFMIKQLAGDLLPGATYEDLIATAFHRQTPNNKEGGTDDEEFRIVAVLDRVATTWSVLNGISMNCAQCHSHPYDPIDHREFYQSYSFFNTTQDADKPSDKPVFLLAKNPEQRDTVFLQQQEMRSIIAQVAKTAQQLAADPTQWRRIDIASLEADEVAALELLMAEHKKTLAKADDKQRAQLNKRIKSMTKAIAELNASQRARRALPIRDGELYADQIVPSKVIYRVQTQPVSSAQTFNTLRLTALPLQPDTALHTPERAFSVDHIQYWFVTENGERTQIPIDSYVANSSEVLDEQLLALNKAAPGQRQIHGDASAFFAQRLFQPRWTVAVLPSAMVVPAGAHLEIELTMLDARPLNGFGASELRRLKVELGHNDAWLDYINTDQKHQVARYAELNAAIKNETAFRVPVMLEQSAEDTRASALFYRGNFLDKRGPRLLPQVPKIFPPLQRAQANNRLTLAQWFFQPEQPLTARVAVNRFWFHLFGRGLVESMEDFGGAGTPPSHPELLDWLALTFQHELNWDMKALLKLIVSSHTYQQSAHISATHYEADPDNVWLARGPRQRLTAEMVRDQALFASGLLINEVGGEPVMPEQPKGIWGRRGEIIADWKNASGDDRYRRAIYTFIKRAYTYPSFLTFDMDARAISHSRRRPTNTPLQALVTLNDPVFVEAAEAFAGNMLKIKNGERLNEGDTIQWAAQRVVSRPLNTDELNLATAALASFQQDAGTENPMQAWTALASVLLNIDAALVR